MDRNEIYLVFEFNKIYRFFGKVEGRKGWEEVNIILNFCFMLFEDGSINVKVNVGYILFVK